MDTAQLDRIITQLEHVQKRPGMYFADNTAAVDNFISGFTLGLILAWIDQAEASSMWRKIVEDEYNLSSNISIHQQLKERGKSDAEATDTILAILIESYKRHRAKQE